ncbi:unnamed protein product, partial [Iphiclides podalirius]
MDPLRTGDHREEGAVPGNAPVPARSSRGKRGRLGRLARPCTIDGQAEGESDGSQVSRISATSEDTRKRKAKAPSGDTVAANYKAVVKVASASATATEGEDKEDGHDTEEDSQDLSGIKLKSTLPNPEGLGLELKSQSNRMIESHIDFQLQEIEKVADRSRNLKGCFVRGLRSAVTSVRAAANELARRSSANGIVAKLEKENAELRSQLFSLAGRMEKLTEEIKHLRKQTQERASKTHSYAQYTPSGPKYMSDEEKMMERIGALVESKLAAFGARLFPGATHQQPLGTTNMVSTKSVQPLPKSAKPKRKKKRDRCPITAVRKLAAAKTVKTPVLQSPETKKGTG